jgi:hypothetical protein
MHTICIETEDIQKLRFDNDRKRVAYKREGGMFGLMMGTQVASLVRLQALI